MRHRCVHVHVWSTPHEMAGRRYVIIRFQVSESHCVVECKKKCRSFAGNRRSTFGSGWEWCRSRGTWTWKWPDQASGRRTGSGHWIWRVWGHVRQCRGKVKVEVMNFLWAFESWEKWCVYKFFSIHIRRKRTSLLFTDISDTYSRHMHWMSLKVSLRVFEIMSHSGEAFSVFPVSLQNTGLICFSEWVQRPVVVLANALAVRHRCVHVHVWSTPHEIAGRRYVYVFKSVKVIVL